MSVFMIFMSLNEELFYRGYLFNYLKQFFANYHILIPLVLSTIIFGFGHFFSGGIAYCSLSIVAGLFYGSVYLLTGNIFYAVLIHSLTNIIQNI
jgi:membrane protease YdiL (CAAX protease family)